MNYLKKTFVQFFKYFGVALIGYVVDFGLLLVSKEVLHLHYLPSAVIGFIAGLLVVYVLSSQFVFGQSKIHSKSVEFGIFATIGVVGLGLLMVLMWLMTDIFHINYLLSKILATAVVYMWNFLARKSLYEN